MRACSNSAIALTTIPAIVGTWDKNIDPNLPAPINPTRTGLLRDAASAARDARFMMVLQISCDVKEHSKSFCLWQETVRDKQLEFSFASNQSVEKYG
jgi:hypothetical protein